MSLLTNLEAAWNFNGNDLDSSGKNCHGASIGGPSFNSVIKKLGPAARELDGNDDAINFGNKGNSIIAGADKKFSNEFWIYIKSFNATNVIFSKFGDVTHSEDERQFTLEVTASGFLQFFYTGALDSSVRRLIRSTDTVMEIEQFYKVAYSHDGSLDGNDGLDRVELFVNDNQESKSLAVNIGVLGDIPVGAARLAVGAAIGTAGPVSYASDMIIDGGKFWSRVVTPTEFTVELWNGGAGLELGRGPKTIGSSGPLHIPGLNTMSILKP